MKAMLNKVLMQEIKVKYSPILDSLIWEIEWNERNYSPLTLLEIGIEAFEF